MERSSDNCTSEDLPGGGAAPTVVDRDPNSTGDDVDSPAANTIEGSPAEDHIVEVEGKDQSPSHDDTKVSQVDAPLLVPEVAPSTIAEKLIDSEGAEGPTTDPATTPKGSATVPVFPGSPLPGDIVDEIQPLPISRQTNLNITVNQEQQTPGAYAVQNVLNAAPTIAANPNETNDNYRPTDLLVEAQLVEEGRSDQRSDDELVVAEEFKQQDTRPNRRSRLCLVAEVCSILALIVTVVVLVITTQRGQEDTSSNLGNGDSATISPTSTLSSVTTTNIVDSSSTGEEYESFLTTYDLREAIAASLAENNTSADAFSRYGPDVGKWSVGELRDFSKVFINKALQEDIGDWNMSNARYMEEMLRGVKNLSASSGIDRWDTSSMTNLQALFMDTTWTEPQLDLSSWNTSGVWTLGQLFRWSNLSRANLSQWDVSNVRYMGQFAERATNFNDDISNWNVQSVTSIQQAFRRAESFNQDLSKWDTRSMRDMHNAFRNASSFNSKLPWDVSKVHIMMQTFRGATAFNQDISSWDVSNVERLEWAFHEAASFNQDISGWNVSKVTDLRWAFQGATSFNQNLCAWGAMLPPNATTAYMFHNTTCINTSDPVFSSDPNIPNGPFCHNCY